MSRKLVLKPRYPSYRRSFWFCILGCFSLLASTIVAQSVPLQEIVQENQKWVAVPPTLESPLVERSDGTVLNLEKFGSLKRFVVQQGGQRVESNWFEQDRNDVWHAYSPQDLRFRELENRLKIRAKDLAWVDSFVKRNSGFQLKVYPTLDYALLHFPAENNPVELAKEIQSEASVQSVELQFVEPREYPL